MKLPDKPLKASEKEQAEKDRKKAGDIVAYRKARKRRSNIIKLSVIAALMLVVIIVASNFTAIIEPFRGIASRIDTRTSSEKGFPVALPGSATYSFDSMGGDFILLTDTYLYAFATDGGQIYALQHGFTNPFQVSNDRRILLYDKGYYDFSMFNRTSRIYSASTEDKIVYGALSKNDMAVIVTDSSRFSNVLYVYDGSGKWKYKRKFTDENVMCAAFSDDEKYVYAVTIGVEDGEIYSAIYKFDISSSEEELWRYQWGTGSIPCLINNNGDIITVVYDDMILALNDKDGSLLNSGNFSGILLAADFYDGCTAVIYNENASNRTVLALYDKDNMPLYSTSVNPSIDEVILDSSNVYIAESGGIKCFDRSLQQQYVSAMDGEYSAFIKIDDYAYLLGYDSVQRQKLG